MSKKLKLTNWFDGSAVKPSRKGVYMLLSGSHIGYQHWNGAQWGIWLLTPEMAEKNKAELAVAHYQNDNWRGLAQKP